MPGAALRTQCFFLQAPRSENCCEPVCTHWVGEKTGSETLRDQFRISHSLLLVPPTHLPFLINKVVGLEAGGHAYWGMHI